MQDALIKLDFFEMMAYSLNLSDNLTKLITASTKCITEGQGKVSCRIWIPGTFTGKRAWI